MGGGFSNTITGGGGSLVRPSIHSPGFVAGLSGWSINRDGSAEFNSATIRGDLIIGANPTTEFTQTIPAELVTFYSPETIGSVQIIGDSSAYLFRAEINGAPTPIEAFGSVISGSVKEFYRFAGGLEPTMTLGRLNPTLLDIKALGDLFFDGFPAPRSLLVAIDDNSVSVGPAAGENIILTMPSATYKNGRAYRVVYYYLAATSGASGAVTTTVRKGTTTAGAQLAGRRRPTVTAAQMVDQESSFILANRSGADVTTQMVLTATPSAGNVTATATTASVFMFQAWDLGLNSESRYPKAISL